VSSTISEYICEDCGTILLHENPTTFQSIKEIHSQLCPIKRQKILANAEADKLKRLAAEKSVTPVLSTQSASNAGPHIAAPSATETATITTGVGVGGAKGISDDTSISLTGSGTSHSAAEGPIDV